MIEIESKKPKLGILERKDIQTVTLACDSDLNNEWRKNGDENSSPSPSTVICPYDALFANKREILKTLDPLASEIDFSED